MENEVKTQNKPPKAQKAAKPSRVSALQQQLEELEAKAKAAREKLRDEQKKERERNARAISDLIKTESLEEFGIEAWRQALPTLRSALEKAETSDNATA